MMMNTACMYLSEALNKHLPSSYPRLHSLRSLSLGLLKVYLSEALRPRLPVVYPQTALAYHGETSGVRQCWGGVYPHPPRHNRDLQPRRLTLDNPRLSEQSECSLWV